MYVRMSRGTFVPRLVCECCGKYVCWNLLYKSSARKTVQDRMFAFVFIYKGRVVPVVPLPRRGPGFNF